MIEQAYASGYGPLKSGNDLKLWLVPINFNEGSIDQEDLIKYARSQKDHSTFFITSYEYSMDLLILQYGNLSYDVTYILCIISSQDYSKFAKEIPMDELDQITKHLGIGQFDDEGNNSEPNIQECVYNLMEKYFPQN